MVALLARQPHDAAVNLVVSNKVFGTTSITDDLHSHHQTFVGSDHRPLNRSDASIGDVDLATQVVTIAKYFQGMPVELPCWKVARGAVAIYRTVCRLRAGQLTRAR